MRRCESPAQVLPRRTTEDVELHGKAIPSERKIEVVWAAASRDEGGFTGPGLAGRPQTRHFHPQPCRPFRADGMRARGHSGESPPVALSGVGLDRVREETHCRRGAFLDREVLEVNEGEREGGKSAG